MSIVIALADPAATVAPLGDVLHTAIIAVCRWAPPIIMLIFGMKAIADFVMGRGAATALRTTCVGAVLCGAMWTLPTVLNGLDAPPDTDTTATPANDTSSSPSAPTPPTATPTSTSPAPQAPQPDSTDSASWLVPIGIVAAVLVAIAGLIGLGILITRVIARRRTARQEAQQRRTAQLQRWALGEKTLNATSAALMEFESDVESVYFTRPLLADVTEPLSGVFYTAYGDALSLQIETTPTDDDQISAFVTAANAAQRAFTAANDNALRKARLGVVHGDRKLTPEEKRKLGQARNLVAQALDHANTPELATTAHSKAQELLDEVGVIVPERLATSVVRSIKTLHQSALTAGAHQ